MEPPISNTAEPSAPRHGDNITDGPVGRLQRSRVHRYLRDRVLADAESLAVLDLGCGSGEDAFFLAGAGHRVYAVDNDRAQLEAARSAAEERGVGDELHFHPLDLKACHGVHFPSPFDLVLADFGVLNCLAPEDVVALAREAASWVRPGGRMVLVVMPRFCLWETVYYLARGPRSNALKRARSGPDQHCSGDTISPPRWYHGISFLGQTFAPAFEIIRTRPIGLVVPPCELGGSDTGEPSALLSALAGIETMLGPLPGLGNLADHCLIDLRRTTAASLESPNSRRSVAVVGQAAPAGAATPRAATPCR